MGASDKAEDTQSSELVELLKKMGLNATFKRQYTTIAGRREPDITIQLPDGLLLCEAKVPPAGLPQAMGQVSEYRRSVGATEKVKGVFALVYSNKLKKDFEAYYSSEISTDLQRFKTLEELAKYILEKTQEKEARVIPISTQKIIHILDESVGLLSASLSKTSTQELEGVLGGRDFFSTVLDYEQESHISDAALKSAAAYLLVNQILFYQILSKETDAYATIDTKEIQSGNDLQNNYFSKVLKKDYWPIFGFNIASTIKDSSSVEALHTTIAAIQLLAPQSLTHDLLGKIFHNLIPLSLRKVVAAYYTNSEAGELLADLAIDNKTDKVIDPSCGSGTLLVASYNRKKSLYDKFGSEQHTRFLENEIYGCDIMPFAAHLAAVNLALQAPLSFTNKVNVIIGDSTMLAPGIEVSSAQDVIRESYKNTKLSEFGEGKSRQERKKIRKGVVDLLEEERGIRLPKFDVVIMNPPFTRFQRIPPEFKGKLAERFSSSRYKQIIHGQLGLHGYFLLLADKLLAPGGRLAAVLPLTTISLEGFYGIIELLLKDYQIENIIVSSGRSAFSENTSLREMLLVAKKEAPVPETATKFTFIHASPEDLTVEKAHEIANKIRKFDGEEEDNSDFFIRQINQQNLLTRSRKLYQTVNLHSPQLVQIEDKIQKYFTEKKGYTTLGNIEKDEKWQIRESTKGVEKLGYYCLSILASEETALKEHDIWVIDDDTENFLKVRQRFTGQTFKIPKSCVVRQFRRFPGQTKILIKKPYAYVVIRKFDDFDRFLSASSLADKKQVDIIKKNLREGEWEKFVIKNSSNLFSFYRGNLSAPGTCIFSVRSDVPTFTGPGSSWSMKIPQQQETLAALWLNSSFVIYQILRDRNETEGGFIGIDKYLLTAIPYPKLDTIDSSELLRLDQEVRNLEFPSLLEQFQRSFEGRKKIDAFFLKYSGMKHEDIERFLTLLYDTMAKELLRLKGVMGK